jgi:hypothetical protein
MANVAAAFWRLPLAKNIKGLKFMKKDYKDIYIQLLQFAEEDIVTLSLGAAGEFDQNNPDRDVMGDDIFD